MVHYILEMALRQYEAQFGKIIVPPGIGLPTEEKGDKA
jgi:hypothetical protein